MALVSASVTNYIEPYYYYKYQKLFKHIGKLIFNDLKKKDGLLTDHLKLIKDIDIKPTIIITYEKETA